VTGRDLMAFVKLDTKILDSTIWIERECREVFITALLMAEPIEFKSPMEAISVNSLEMLGFTVPPGWYGFVPAAGQGIIRRALVPEGPGMQALEKLCSPDNGSRSAEHEGRRMVRVSGGYVILNYMKYRDRDHTAAERQRRLRARKRMAVESQSRVTVSQSRATSRIADADADAEADTDKEKILKPLASPQAASLVRGSGFYLELNTGEEYEVPEIDLAEYRRLYPAVDVAQSLRSMRGWLLADKTRRKTAKGIKRFITSWLDRQQNRSNGNGHGPQESFQERAKRRTGEALAEFGEYIEERRSNLERSLAQPGDEQSSSSNLFGRATGHPRGRSGQGVQGSNQDLCVIPKAGRHP